MLFITALTVSGSAALTLSGGTHRAASHNRRTVTMGLFDELFKKDENAELWKDQQMRDQQEILARRRNPAAQAEARKAMEARRAAANKEANDKIAWQRAKGVDPLLV